MSDPRRWLRAGIVGRPHGLDGSFHVGDAVAALLKVDVGVRVGDSDRRIMRRAGFDAGVIIRLEGCENRIDAQALGGEEILIARERTPELGPDEWWAPDLEGCSVRDGGTRVGVVTRLIGLPSCEVLEVARDTGGQALLVPLIADAVRSVDVTRREIQIDLRFLGEK